jgi:addiction module HigA family antidote
MKKPARPCPPHPDLPPVHPGALLRDVVVPGVERTKTQIARDLGISRQTLYDLLAERQPVTAQMAVRLGAYFSNSAEFWLKMQAAYDLWHAEREVDTTAIPALTGAV